MRPEDHDPSTPDQRPSVGADPGSAPELWSHSEPVWAAGRSATWTDYTVVASVIQGTPRPPGAVAVGTGMDVRGAHRVGLVFRAPDLRNGYVWEVDGEAGTLTPMVRIDDDLVPLSDPIGFQPIPSGQPFRVRIGVSGDQLTTWIDDVVVHIIADHRWASGGVGLTSPANARSVLESLQVTGPAGELLLDQDFSDGRTVFAVGAVVDGRLQVAERSNGLYPVHAEWAFVRGELVLPDVAVRSAALFVAASSPEPGRQFVQRTMINGAEVGIGPTRAVADETRYDRYDVTDRVRPGANAIGLLAWTTRDQRLQVELVVETEQGERLYRGSDQTWRGIDAAAVYPTVGSIGTGYYAAPVEDLQQDAYPVGFSEPGFDDQDWPAVVSRPAFADLQPNPTAAVEVEHYLPITVRPVEPDTVVLDFGRTHVGGIRLRGTLDRPWELTLRFAELLDADGRPRYRMATGNQYQDHWSLPAGQVDATTWGLRVFRYIELVGPDAVAAADLISARGHVYQLGRAASVVTDDRQLNAVLELCRTTMLSNNVNLLVDSWSREREPYEADAYLQARCNAAVGSDTTMTRYALEYLFRRRTWPTEWPFHLVLASHEYWLRSADASLLHDHYHTLRQLLPEQWLDDGTGLVRKDFGNDGSSSRIDHDIVDWPPSERDGYVFGPVNTVVNSLAHGAFRTMAEIADVLARDADAAQLRATADRLAEAINTRLWDDARSCYRDGLDSDGRPIDHHAQHADVFAAAFGVATPERLAIIGERLAADGIRTSVYVAPFLLEALYAAGRPEDAHRLMINTGPRSWLSMIEQGAGATMEAWNEALKPNVSCAHPWAASPLFLVAERMAGIRPTAAGHREFEVRPQPGGVGLIRQIVPTLAGTISVTIRAGTQQWRVELTVPAGSTCRLVLPDELTEITDGLDHPIDRSLLSKLTGGDHLIVAARPAESPSS